MKQINHWLTNWPGTGQGSAEGESSNIQDRTRRNYPLKQNFKSHKIVFCNDEINNYIGKSSLLKLSLKENLAFF